MAAVNPATATSVTISQLLQKLGDLDPDFRFMSLNDLLNVLVHGRPDILQTDYNTASRTVDNLVRALDDQNGEVQNLAIKCLGPLVSRIQPNLVGPLIEKLSTLKLRVTSDNAVPSLALKAVIEALPHPVPGEPPSKEAVDAYLHISRVLIPRLIGRSGPTSSSAMASKNARSSIGDSSFESNTDLIIESVDVVIEVVRCFGPLLQPVEVEALHDAIISLLQDGSSSSSGRSTVSSAVKKRAVVAVSILAIYLPDEALAGFITQTVKTLNNVRTAPVTQRLHISILGSMARSIPQRFGRHVDAVAPFILASLSDQTLAVQLEAVGEGNDNSNDFNEIREAALVALEAFLASCPNQMRPYTEEAIQACLRYLKYDPNFIGDDDDEMEDADDDDDDDGFGDDDDEFEADATFDDDGDGSWKLRRCAAKAMRTLISTRSSGDLLENGVLYREAAPLLIQRFSEREETVRIEIISAVSLLVRKTGEGLMPDFALDLASAADGQPSTSAMVVAAQQAPLSRKRRRQSSSGGNAAVLSDRESLASPTASEKPGLPPTGPRADLAERTPSIVAAAAKLLKGKQIPTKQSIISLLDDIVTVQHGGLADFFLQILGPVLEAVKPASGLPALSASSMSVQTGSGTTSVTPATMRVAALRLLGHMSKTHSLQALQAYLPDMVDVLVAVVRDRFYKISAEAISAAEEVVKLITPPRAATATAAKFKPELQKLYTVLMDRVSSPEVDAEVRQKAIQALGTLLSHTGAASDGELLLSPENRRQALDTLLERLQNETTRLASVRAINRIAAYASSASSAADSVPFDAVWTRRVAVELSSQLRKANRSLRGSSIQALRHLVQSSTGSAAATAGLLDDDTLATLASALQPVLANTNDAQLLSPALRILASLVQQQPQLVVTPPIIASLCTLLRSSIVTPSVLDPVLRLVTVIGRSGHGQPLMAGLLQDFGVAIGDPAVVGKVIGALLVSGGASAGVSIDSFIAELKTAKGGASTDPTRASLAITVLGEAGLRLGTAAIDSPIQPALFLDLFASEFDKVSMLAAVALGRAAAGNVPLYLPVILDCISAANSNSNTQYLALQSLKEVLQQVALEQSEQNDQTAATDISPYTKAIWTQLLAASDVENNKAACAECLGRLAMLAPLEFMARLGELLTNAATPLRAMALQALRYTLSLSETGSSGSNDAFDAYLREQLVPMLHTAQKDPDLEIRRLAMTALNSAAHNKPELILGQLNQLLPFIMEESKIKPQLIREVQMGPFKHLVDDGLEVRKGAYETLYALMETAFSRISILGLFERILAGLADDHDIRSMCNLMLSRLAYAAPEETARHLDSIADRYRAILSTKLKDNAVKQEHEKQDDANKGVLRTTMLLAERLKAAAAAAAATAGGGMGSSSSGSSGAGSGAGGAVAVAVTDLGAHQQKWLQYCEWVNKTFEPQLRGLREETRDFGGSGSGGARAYNN